LFINLTKKDNLRRRKRKPAQQAIVDYRTNRRIRVREVRLIDHNGENHGVVPTNVALEMAVEAKLDLVEVAPNSRPPVCRIMDYGKFAYEQTKKEKAARKQQKKVEIKEIRLSIDTADFHRDIKVKNARKWLGEDKKVKVSIRFYGREITRPQLGQEVMESVAKELSDISTIEQKPNLEGRKMIMVLTPEMESAE
jgi:translation initiation factor IF-3